MNHSDLFKEISARLGVSHAGAARLLGYSGSNVAVTASTIASGKKGMSGPAQRALEYLAQGVPDETMARLLPEYIIGTDPTNPEDFGGETYLIRLWYPRFLGVLRETSPQADAATDHVAVDQTETLYIIQWMDDPAAANVSDVLARAAAAVENFDIDNPE